MDEQAGSGTPPSEPSGEATPAEATPAAPPPIEPPPGAPPPIAPPVNWSQAPAEATGIPVPGSPGVYFAGMWPRFAAYLVDTFLLIVVNILVVIVVGIAAPGAATAVGAVTGALISAAYFILQWRGDHRATYGMRALGIQVGNAFDGVRLTDRQALIRWAMLGYPLGILGAISGLAGLAGLIDVILVIGLFLTTLGSTTRQGWHDQFANSAVVRRPGTTGSSSAAVIIVVVVLFLVIVPFVAIVGLIALGGQMSNILSTIGNSI